MTELGDNCEQLVKANDPIVPVIGAIEFLPKARPPIVRMSPPSVPRFMFGLTLEITGFS